MLGANAGGFGRITKPRHDRRHSAIFAFVFWFECTEAETKLTPLAATRSKNLDKQTCKILSSMLYVQEISLNTTPVFNCSDFIIFYQLIQENFAINSKEAGQ